MGSCRMAGTSSLGARKTTMPPKGMLLRRPVKCPEIHASSQPTANKKLCKGGRYLSSSQTEGMADTGTCQWGSCEDSPLRQGHHNSDQRQKWNRNLTPQQQLVVIVLFQRGKKTLGKVRGLS